jgi:hypothetical protein
MVPSTLFVDLAGNAHYLGSPTVPNSVTLSERPLILTPPSSVASALIVIPFEKVITDTAQTINVTGPGAFHWGGSGTHQVFTLDPVPSLTVDVTGSNDIVNVNAIDYPVLVRHIGPGLATVNAGAAGGVAGIQGPLQVAGVGFGSFIHLNVVDTNDPSLPTVTLGANSVQFAGVASPISFAGGITSVDVFGGKGGDVFMDQTLSSTTPVIVHGNSLGANTLVSRIGLNDWNITGINAGGLHNITFSNVQHLSGNVFSVADRFHFSNGAAETGSIHGGIGPGYLATLDFTQYTTLVTVDLKLNLALADGIATSVSNINDVLGGSGNNILVGNGNNFLRGGIIGNGRDILISGGGSSTLQAGSGEAVMIGAHYTQDMNLVALNKLMAEWSHTYVGNPLLDFQIRANHLQHGGGLNDPFLLNPATLVPQPGVTTMVSGGGPDLIFTDAGDILAKPVRPIDIVIFV